MGLERLWLLGVTTVVALCLLRKYHTVHLGRFAMLITFFLVSLLTPALLS